LNISGHIEKQLEVDKILRWCLHIRDNYICNLCKILASLKKKSEVCLSLNNKCSTIDDTLNALCGISRHTASSENYFMESTYYTTILRENLIMNVEGQVVNVLPLIKAQAKKSWSCDISCKIDDLTLIERYQTFLETINTCTLKNVPKLLTNIHKCTIKTSNIKMGHTHSCYIDSTLCKGLFLPVLLLSPHFPKVRNIKRLIYQLTSFYQKILKLDEALNCADLNTLNEIIIVAQEKVYKRQ